jgi:hypothetical protein
MAIFHIRNLKNAASEFFTGETEHDALVMASVHFFGEKPTEINGDKNGVNTLLRNSENGNVIGRLYVLSERNSIN